MKVLFHLTMPASPRATSDAVVQEVLALRDSLGGGRINHLYPGKRPGSRLPRRWWGMQQLFSLVRAEKKIDLHHIFNPDPFPFALLRYLRRPVVYTAVAGLGRTPAMQVTRLAGQVQALVLPTEADRQTAAGWSISNVHALGPIFDLSRFTYQPPPPPPFTLLMASAPWTAAQFQSKGVDALLSAVQQQSDLQLVFLWRGLLYAEMMQRIKAAGVQKQVEVIDKHVDVNQILARVHATILLVTDPGLIKAHPHSLLESLAAGRPILVSSQLPIAELVRETGCGMVLEQVDAAGVRGAVAEMQREYGRYQKPAQAALHDRFPSPLSAYLSIYTEALKNG